jgi:hypothetical protein
MIAQVERARQIERTAIEQVPAAVDNSPFGRDRRSPLRYRVRRPEISSGLGGRQ